MYMTKVVISQYCINNLGVEQPKSSDKLSASFQTQQKDTTLLLTSIPPSELLQNDAYIAAKNLEQSFTPN